MAFTFFMFAQDASCYSFSYLPSLEVLGYEIYESLKNFLMVAKIVAIKFIISCSSIVDLDFQLMLQMHKEAFSPAH